VSRKLFIIRVKKNINLDLLSVYSGPQKLDQHLRSDLAQNNGWQKGTKMSNKRKIHSAKFKAKIALEAYKLDVPVLMIRQIEKNQVS
jgi:hypothetical protein